ncbi:hypothetical protein PTE30175_04294 [Pandoraea terrae]|uniref:Uncharacterized protein n=1 Tax=Pandoraea terrae TaxID=1537710 RepID=A0A5E4YB68_9BURK|nr:nodulation protein NfeD [Pandoraea terrae]VVE45668.1 hypothetical protein PTE30175_04294 [Pandoraea terrae]
MVRMLRWLLVCLLGLCAVAPAAEPASQPPPGAVFVLPVTGAIGPASAAFVEHGLHRAQEMRAALVVLEMDTPGGLDVSMRQIIKAILASPVPVATFVAPGGARAASAGTYILYASHVAAMAPGTNLGAATPIRIGIPTSPGGGGKPDEKAKPANGEDTESTLARKQMQDAIAYIRSLAQLRGRNADWAERAVRESVSLPASDAVRDHVVDLLARDTPDLLRQIDGRRVETIAGPHVLHTRDARIEIIKPDWRTQLFTVITDPSVALILMMIGVYGLFFEFANPGFVLPGVAGAICLLLGLFALQTLPINYAGLALVMLGISFLIAEAFLPTFGTLGIGGIVAFSIGAVMLIDTDAPGFGVPISLIVALAVTTGLFIFGVSSFALRARRRPVVTGREAILGAVGVMLSDVPQVGEEGWATVHSERWRVRSTVPLAIDQRIRVQARDGLVLTVAPLSSDSSGAS